LFEEVSNSLDQTEPNSFSLPPTGHLRIPLPTNVTERRTDERRVNDGSAVASTPRTTARPSVTECWRSTPVQEWRREFSTRHPQTNVAASQEDERNVGNTRRTSGEDASTHDRRLAVGDADAAAGRTGGVGGGGRRHRRRSPQHRLRSAARRRLPQRSRLEE
jgi:hypothetical protein